MLADADQPDRHRPSPEQRPSAAPAQRAAGRYLLERLEQEGEPLLVLEEECGQRPSSSAIATTRWSARRSTASWRDRCRHRHPADPAFSLYFQLVNVAELEHRVQVIRSIQAVPREGRRPGNLPRLFTRAGPRRRRPERLLAALRRAGRSCGGQRPPTEAVRRSVLDHVNGCHALDALDGPPPGSPRHATLVASMRRDMELLWQTEELRTVRPTVLDEAATSLPSIS